MWVRFGVKFSDIDGKIYKDWVMAPDYATCERFCNTIVEASPTYVFYLIVYPLEEIPQ